MNGNYFYFMVAYDIVQMKDDYSGVFSGMEEWGKSERQGDGGGWNLPFHAQSTPAPMGPLNVEG